MSVRVRLPGAELVIGARWPLDAALKRYLVTVRRLKTGTSVVLTNGDGLDADGRLEEGPEGWSVTQIGPARAGQTGRGLTLCYGLSKGDKVDRVVRQATELGVSRVRLLNCDRSVVRLDPGRITKRMERLTRIAEAAARQCGRADVPILDPPSAVQAALNDLVDHTTWVLHLVGGAALKDAPATLPLAIYIGPEGGFSPAEISAFQAAATFTLTLKTPTLRTETAAPVACALALAQLGLL